MAILKLQQAKQSGDRSPTTNIIGKIFKGAPKSNGKVGKNLDYFRFVAKGRSAEEIQEVWDRFYAIPSGGEPREITISFPYNNIEWNLNEWFCEFGKSGLKTKCNGSQIVEWRDEKNGNIFQTDKPKPCRAPDNAKGCGTCKASDLLKFKIFEFESYGYDGIVELTTGSIHDISYLRDRLTEIQQTLANINLPLRGTPLVLYRETRTITKTINGNSSRSEESLLGLKLHPMLQKKLNEALERRLYAIIDAVGTASIPISGTVEHQVLGSAEPRMAIAPSQEPTVKDAFKAELLALEIEVSDYSAVIGNELWNMGYKGDKQGKGNANLIPIDKIKEVAQAIANKINPKPVATEAIATPVTSEVANDDDWDTLDAQVLPETV